MKIFFIILVISSIILISGCQSADERPQLSESTSINQSESIVNTDFEIDNIDFIGMTYGEVKEIMGSDGEDVGSGAIIFQWELEDGRVLLVWLSGKTSDSIEDLVVTGFKLQNKSPFT